MKKTIYIIAARKKDIEKGRGNPFKFWEVSECKHKRGYSKAWEVYEVKGYIEGMIKSNLIMEQRKRLIPVPPNRSPGRKEKEDERLGIT